ncbi:MAG: L-glutamate gamma-semialdehyde dehydrogenase [Anaerolineae bacterium]
MVPERGPFKNIHLADFSDPREHLAFEDALTRVRSRFGEEHPLVIGGEEIWLEDTFASVNPAHPDEVVGVFARADVRLAQFAIDTAYQAFETWKRVPAERRAQYLFDAADIIRERRHEFSAWMVYEVGKSWVEADADTAEAIDFLEYYGRLMIRLDRGEYVQNIPGERDEMRYIPLGVCAVIPPWNFPLAIMGGMSSAAIVAGNTVVLKPAGASPKIAWEFFQVMREVSLPDGVFNFITGPGAVVGEALVDHPKTRFIAFTGSKEVGIRINGRAAKVQPGQIWLKRTILEMGGKDAVVVDETADLDDAALGIVVSAFGYQGQKCSAGSRAIVVQDVYDALLEKVIRNAREIVTVGDPDDPQNYMGPVIDDEQYRKILDYIDIGRGEGRLVLGGKAMERDGWFIEPTIFADVDPEATISLEEIFGPVLAIIKAEDFDDALRVANNTEFGLTGSLYSRSPERIERAKDDFHVGNLYFNRKCTGALVGVHPFGGFNMSGTDSKAGGPDYLLLFTQAKAIGEKIL